MNSKGSDSLFCAFYMLYCIKKYIFCAISYPLSANELSEELGCSSVNTTKKFMDYLHEPYLFYYLSRNDKEVDFVLRKGTRVERLVQVCYDMSSPKTEKREVDSIVECAGELKCDNLTIVTNDEERTIEKDGYTIAVVSVRKF